MSDAAKPRHLEAFAQDLRFALRQFRKAPGFALVTVTILALGIGAGTAIFSVVDGVLLRPLPYPEPDRIVTLWEVSAQGNPMHVADPNFDDLLARTRSFTALAQVADFGTVSVTGGREPVRARASSVGGDFFEALGVPPLLGRAFGNAEQRPGAEPTAVVSHGFWQRALGGRTDVLGTVLQTAGRAYTVIGVMPPIVDEPAGTDIWSPRGLEGHLTSRTAHNWGVIGRLEPGVSLSQAQLEVAGLVESMRREHGDRMDAVSGALVPLHEQLVGGTRPALLVLLAASLVLHLIACSNAVNLLVARLVARQGEIAIRTALGAGRARLLAQLLAESLVLSLAGGALGVALASAGVPVLLALQTAGLPRTGDVTMSWRVLGFAALLSLGVASAMAFVAAWRSPQSDVRDVLAASQRTATGGARSGRVRIGLVVAQIAMTLALLVSAGLLGRSFQRLLTVRPGFVTENAVVLDVSMPDAVSDLARTERIRVYDTLAERLRAIPGVTAVGGVSTMPLALQGGADGTFVELDRPDQTVDWPELERLFRDTSRAGHAEFRVAGPGYFEAMRIPVVSGRAFDDRDDRSTAPVALISMSLADARWPGRDVVGKVIEFGNMDGDLRPFTVIGVVGDVREADLSAAPRPTFYASYRQRPVKAGELNFVLATVGDPGPVMAAALSAARQVAPDVPPRLRAIEAIVSRSLADRRFILVLVGTFGAAALLLAMLGLYGVVSFLVEGRRRELSLRMALGAASGDILRLVLGQGARMALLGLAAGSVLAWGGTRVLGRFLYGIAPTDPLAFGTVALLLGVVALVASGVPAWRAARVPPNEALRG